MTGRDGEGTPEAGVPPAGLREHLPSPASRPVRGTVAAVLLALVAGAALWAAFTGVGPARFDTAALGESIEVRSTGLTSLAVLVTTLGSTAAMAVLAVVVGAWAWARGSRADAVLVVGAMAGAAVVFRGLKILLDRPRPPTADQLVMETNESLPSGHATMSVVVVGSLVVLAWAGRGTLARVAITSAAALWIGAVGGTRIYLGVHWLSDVLAGWLTGAAWLALCVTLWSAYRAHHPSPVGG